MGQVVDGRPDSAVSCYPAAAADAAAPRVLLLNAAFALLPAVAPIALDGVVELWHLWTH